MMTKKTMSTQSGTLARIRELLDQNLPEQALDYINHLGQETPEAKNALAVCLLRLGRTSEAASILRDIAFRGRICMPDDTPLLFQLNFATAMLMANFKDAAIAVMDRLEGEKDPQAVQLREAIEGWRKNLGFVGQLRCRLGFYPKQPVKLDFPPGRV
jgi:hypothetical protein